MEARARGGPVIALVMIPLCWALLRLAVTGPLLPSAVARHLPVSSPAEGLPPSPIGHVVLPKRFALAGRNRVRRRDAGFARPNRASRPAGGRTGNTPRHSKVENSGREEAGFIRLRADDIPSRSPPAPRSGMVVGQARQPEPVRRWRADAWVAWRPGGGSPGAGSAAVPLYGASQAGAVLRYDLAPGSRHRPAAYARVVSALAGSRDGDVAAGLAARPLPPVPLTAHVEVRLSRSAGGTALRPAAFVAAGFDEAPLPLGMLGRGYAQAGYVGGRGATAFADGSLVAGRRLLRRGDTVLEAGAGLWAGAQRGAARLDVGPSAGLRFPLGGGTGRIAVDYRLRAAGNAAPASGVALTLSAGF